jgi:hypothetical protein
MGTATIFVFCTNVFVIESFDMPRLPRTQLIKWFYIVSLSLGGILIIIGFLYNKELIGNIAAAVGSAIIGAVISLLFAGLIQADPLDWIYDSLANHVSILSDDNALSPYRKRLHHYHVTSIKGKRIWRYRIYDFSASIPGRLVADTKAGDAAGQLRPYRIQAGIRGERFILFDKAKDKEEPVTIEVYPTITTPTGQYAGVGIMQTWDGPTFVTRCLLSEIPISNIQAEGDVPDANWHELQAAWDASMKNIEILPGT